MKRLITTISMALAVISISAQRLLIVGSDKYEWTERYALSDIERVTYEEDIEFTNNLLANKIALDEKTTIFSAALKITGLADSINVYQGKDATNSSGYYQDGRNLYFPDITIGSTFYWIDYYPSRFSVFVETDSVFRLNGINDIDDLKAYAKQVYDQVYPEDASISEPTHRRNSLNRFVAYHLLPFYVNYDMLASCNRYNYKNSVHELCSYYETMMPYSSLKISFWGARNYLNHRGIGRPAEVKGICSSSNYDMDWKGYAQNGAYYYIDSLLTYDIQTQEQVLTDHWTVDFRSLSPNIMNLSSSGSSYSPFCYGLKAENLQNIQADEKMTLVYLPTNQVSLTFEGDAFYCIGGEDFTVKLPPLPKGEWQIRMGTRTEGGNRLGNIVNIYIDDVLQREKVNLIMNHAEEDFGQNGIEHGPDFYYPQGSKSLMSESLYNVSHLMGTLQSDGKTDHYLRIQNTLIYSYTTLIDYFEFIPINKQ